MEIRTKISLVNDQGSPFMGPGILKLLRRIEEHRSINKAAKAMNLSYVKALNLLNRLEQETGESILIRTRGGNRQGGSELTPTGKRFLKAYDRLEQRVRERADNEFRRFLRATERGRSA